MKRKDILTRSFADGGELSIPVFYCPGTDKGAPSVYIQSGIHGAEVQGYVVTLQLIEYFSNNPPKGDITIIPIANPYGLNCKIGEYTFGRFDPVTGDNWNRNYADFSGHVDEFLEAHPNRSFKELVVLFKQFLKQSLSKKLQEKTSYHKKLALQLQELAISADIVLDLHCDTISVPHIYSSEYAMRSVSALRIPFVIEIPSIFAGALDEAIFCPWIELIEKYKKINHLESPINMPMEVFTVELGNQEDINTKKSHLQTKGILNYLSVKGVCDALDNLEKFNIYSCKLKDFITIYSPTGGLITDNADFGIELPSGEEIISLSAPSLWKELTTTTDLIANSTHTIKTQCPAIPITRAASVVVNEGMALMKLMTNFRHS